MTTEDINAIISAMWHHGHRTEKIKETLIEKGFDQSTIDEVLTAFKKEYHAKQLHKGFICLIIGGFIGFISCVLSVFNPFPDLYHWILYGLTSVSVLVIVAGLYFIFE